MSSIAPYLKAVFAFITPGAVSLGYAVTEASKGGDKIVQSEWIAALIACVVTAAAVFAVPNKDPEGTHQAESTMPPERGAVDVGTVVLVAVLVLLVLIVFGFVR